MSEEQDHYSSIMERCAQCSMSSRPGSGCLCPSLIHLCQCCFLSCLLHTSWCFKSHHFLLHFSYLTHIHLTLSGQSTHPFILPTSLFSRAFPSPSFPSTPSVICPSPYKRTSAGTLASFPPSILQSSLYFQDSREL